MPTSSFAARTAACGGSSSSSIWPPTGNHSLYLSCFRRSTRLSWTIYASATKSIFSWICGMVCLYDRMTLPMPQPYFFDAHTHVQFFGYDADRDAVIRRAIDAGVRMVNVGTQKDTSRLAVELAHKYQEGELYAAIGLHPIHTGRSHHDADELGGGEAAK